MCCSLSQVGHESLAQSGHQFAVSGASTAWQYTHGFYASHSQSKSTITFASHCLSPSLDLI